MREVVRIKNQKGQATIEFLVISTLVFVIIFGAVDYWIATMRIQQGEHIKNFYLDRARITGYLSEDDRADLVNEMKAIGFKDIVITAPETPVARDINNHPVIDLVIVVNFAENPFMLSYVLGTSENTQITFQGRTFSEYYEST